jgi:hypothetical protein
MICPKCGDEYREGVIECAECQLPLVPKPPETETEPPHPDLVTVYTTGNAALIPVIESVLRDAGIQFLTKSAGLQDFFA